MFFFQVYDTLTPEEHARNMTGPSRLFVGKQHTLFEFVHKVHMQGKRNGRMVLAVNNTNRMENSGIFIFHFNLIIFKYREKQIIGNSGTLDSN
jgi:hypothetical protein